MHSFRRDNDSKSKKSSLRIITEQDSSSKNTTSRVRQRFSALFGKSSTPVIERKVDELPVPLTLESNKSTDSFSSSSDNSDHMPASPADFNSHSWMISAPIPPPHQLNMSSLAFQVHTILGSTINEVDKEIDLDWENSRRKLTQSLLIQTSQLSQF